MTIVVWDGRFLASDTRTLQEHTFKEENKLTSDEAYWLHEKFRNSGFNFSNVFYKVEDGQRKLVIPTKPLFYAKVPVRAVGVSGATAYCDEIRDMPSGFDLLSPDSPFFRGERRGGMFIVITNTHVITQSASQANSGSFTITTHHSLDNFNCVGAGVVAELCGLKPILNAVDFVNLSCFHSETQGGDIDVWDSVTGKTWRQAPDSFERRMDLTNAFFDIVLKNRRMSEGLDVMVRKRNEHNSPETIGKRVKPLWPDMYIRKEDGIVVLNPEYQGEPVEQALAGDQEMLDKYADNAPVASAKKAPAKKTTKK